MNPKPPNDDFISWEDLDLDHLLGEYTDVAESSEEVESKSESESDVDLSQPQQQRRKPGAKSWQYQCPDNKCRKLYRSIAGFRGHLSKKHGMEGVKASLHRVKPTSKTGLSSPGPRSSVEARIPPVKENNILCTFEEFAKAFPEIFHAALVKISKDPLNNSPHSIHGHKIVQMATAAQSNEHPFLWLKEQFYEIVSHLTVTEASGRQTLLRKLHLMRTDTSVTDRLRSCVIQATKTTEQTVIVNYFSQMLLEELLDEFLRFGKSLVKAEIDKQSTNSNLSIHTREVLHYVTGFILNKFLRSKNVPPSDKAVVSGFVQGKLTESGKENLSGQWTERLNRGGLKCPKKDAFDLLLAAEIEIRSKCNLSTVNCDTIKKDILLECLLDSPSVNRAWSILVPGFLKGIPLLEKLLKLFLTIRGFAFAKLIKKQTISVSKGGKALRKSLKEKKNSVE